VGRLLVLGTPEVCVGADNRVIAGVRRQGLLGVLALRRNTDMGTDVLIDRIWHRLESPPAMRAVRKGFERRVSLAVTGLAEASEPAQGGVARDGDGPAAPVRWPRPSVDILDDPAAGTGQGQLGPSLHEPVLQLQLARVPTVVGVEEGHERR
jgi:hypothetical protein